MRVYVNQPFRESVPKTESTGGYWNGNSLKSCVLELGVESAGILRYQAFLRIQDIRVVGSNPRIGNEGGTARLSSSLFRAKLSLFLSDQRVSLSAG